MNTDWTGIYTCKEYHKTEYRWNHTTTDHKEGEQLEDRRNVGKNSCNSGDWTDRTGTIIDVYDDDEKNTWLLSGFIMPKTKKPADRRTEYQTRVFYRVIKSFCAPDDYNTESYK